MFPSVCYLMDWLHCVIDLLDKRLFKDVKSFG